MQRVWAGQGKLREIVFDTETTGLRPEEGERIIEIGAVELVNGFPTGNSYHAYINPRGRPVHAEALAVHGITDEFLKDKPDFPAIAESFLQFVSDATLVAHNAPFDLGFVNAELGRLGVDPIPQHRVVDTLALARRKHPMGPNSLDALCARYGIDNSHRTKHGALLDAELLAEVYIEMSGGRQAALELGSLAAISHAEISVRTSVSVRLRSEPLAPRLTDVEIESHRQFVGDLAAQPVWADYSIIGLP
jgi:DNA polymerase III subunit epsilon